MISRLNSPEKTWRYPKFGRPNGRGESRRIKKKAKTPRRNDDRAVANAAESAAEAGKAVTINMLKKGLNRNEKSTRAPSVARRGSPSRAPLNQ
ncbi:hypothetical protein WR25_17121 [Diploscapter pachys]|uniref:Uncharacterized protein n=1 Tax=Diploscapter pachys TaxID=2018661 RepID=A0A2A2LKX1_9BILA|nr:hypothetical protein WR25_17121 [Diploscapter pachys]